MDINDYRSWVTVFSLIVFLAMVWWTYRRSNQAAFTEAANLPFLNEDTPASEPEGERK